MDSLTSSSCCGMTALMSTHRGVGNTRTDVSRLHDLAVRGATALSTRQQHAHSLQLFSLVPKKAEGSRCVTVVRRSDSPSSWEPHTAWKLCAALMTPLCTASPQRSNHAGRGRTAENSTRRTHGPCPPPEPEGFGWGERCWAKAEGPAVRQRIAQMTRWGRADGRSRKRSKRQRSRCLAVRERVDAAQLGRSCCCTEAKRRRVDVCEVHPVQLLSASASSPPSASPTLSASAGDASVAAAVASSSPLCALSIPSISFHPPCERLHRPCFVYWV